MNQETIEACIKEKYLQIEKLNAEIESLKCLDRQYVIQKRNKYAQDLWLALPKKNIYRFYHSDREHYDKLLERKIEAEKKMYNLIGEFEAKYNITEDEINPSYDFNKSRYAQK